MYCSRDPFKVLKVMYLVTCIDYSST